MKYDLVLPKSGFVTAHFVKKHYKISNSTMYKWVAEKHLPSPVKIGPRAIRFRAEDLQEFEKRCSPVT